MLTYLPCVKNMIGELMNIRETFIERKHKASLN
jgi:hypothetical protein